MADNTGIAEQNARNRKQIQDYQDRLERFELLYTVYSSSLKTLEGYEKLLKREEDNLSSAELRWKESERALENMQGQKARKKIFLEAYEKQFFLMKIRYQIYARQVQTELEEGEPLFRQVIEENAAAKDLYDRTEVSLRSMRDEGKREQLQKDCSEKEAQLKEYAALFRSPEYFPMFEGELATKYHCPAFGYGAEEDHMTVRRELMLMQKFLTDIELSRYMGTGGLDG